MVGVLNDQSRLLRELDWQDVNSSLSHTHSVSCPVDPMQRYWISERPFVATEASVAARLQNFQSLFEWAYGYRIPKHSRRRLTRRAPSAGALYPTEIFLVIETGRGWRVLYYQFIKHQFYVVPVQNPEAIPRNLQLLRGSEAILFSSMLWRTVQRYGARGYRYCLLDAALVTSNLVQAALTFRQEMHLTLQGPTSELETLLNLHNGEALVLTLQCCPTAVDVMIPSPPKLPNLPQLHPKMTEHPPLLSPVLQRVTSFHRKTLDHHFYTARDLRIAPHETPGESYTYTIERQSAKEFTGEFVPFEHYVQMVEAFLGSSLAIRQQTSAITAYALTLRVENLPAGVVHLDSGYTRTPSTLFEQTITEIADRLSEACQNQVIMKSCAFVLVLVAQKSEVADNEHIGYRHMVLNAGFICANLYREATRHFLGTTTIGGFSDDAICHLINDRAAYPIVIQAFGVPSFSADKVDAARIVGMPPQPPHKAGSLEGELLQ